MSTTEDNEEEKFKCPINGECSTRRRHRVCNSEICKGRHCWDCCDGCHMDCPEPSGPDVEEWVAPT